MLYSHPPIVERIRAAREAGWQLPDSKGVT